MKNIDLNFDISSCALAIANILTDKVPCLIDGDASLNMRTYPLYNGRERLICIVLEKNYGDNICISFGEHRNTDNIIVDIFSTKNFYPTFKDMTDEQYENREFFKYNEHYKVAEFICEKLSEFISNNK